MEICDFIYLDCKESKNRKKLIKLVKQETKRDKLTKENLQTMCKSLSKKYFAKIRVFDKKSYSLVSVEFQKGSLSCFYCNSFSELMCKYILLVKYYKDNNLIVKR